MEYLQGTHRRLCPCEGKDWKLPSCESLVVLLSCKSWNSGWPNIYIYSLWKLSRPNNRWRSYQLDFVPSTKSILASNFLIKIPRTPFNYFIFQFISLNYHPIYNFFYHIIKLLLCIYCWEIYIFFNNFFCTNLN